MRSAHSFMRDITNLCELAKKNYSEFTRPGFEQSNLNYFCAGVVNAAQKVFDSYCETDHTFKGDPVMGDELKIALEERYAKLCINLRRMAKETGTASELYLKSLEHIKALERLADFEGYFFHKSPGESQVEKHVVLEGYSDVGKLEDVLSVKANEESKE